MLAVTKKTMLRSDPCQLNIENSATIQRTLSESQACTPLAARQVSLTRLPWSRNVFAGDHGVNGWPPHFFFIIKIQEIQSQDKNIIELWTEKIQEFTMTGEWTRAILPWCPRAASARWQAFHLHSLPWTAFGSEWS